MENILGFLLINVYSLLIIIATSVVFFSKQRLKQTEDETYKNFLIANIYISLSGIILGLAVSPGFNTNDFLIALCNKIYLIALIFWISIMTYYYVYISWRTKKDLTNTKKIFNIITIISILIILFIPITVNVTPNGAVASGPAIMFTYTMFGLGFILQIICVLTNYKNLKSKKYIPLYMLIILGSIVLVSMMINPTLNYLINPIFNFIAVIMFHTIENPDMQMIDTLLRNKELVEQTVNDKSNFLFKISQEMKKPIQNIIKDVRLYKEDFSKEETKLLISDIDSEANNAYFIINDIASVSSMDVKNLKVSDNKYKTEKLFLEIKSNVTNQLSIKKKEGKIKFSLNINNKYPEYLHGDNIKLKQVILSIVNNSIKYTNSGFIDIDVDVITRYDGCRMIFTIKDSGCGMSLYKINSLLSSNEELTAEEFNKIDSLDMKIPVVIKILKLLGGSISIKSVEDKGTIVVVVIDQSIDFDSTSEFLLKEAKKYNSGIKGRKRILVADDSKELDKIKRLLSKENVDVITTLIGKDVIDKIQNGEHYDLIILKDNLRPDTAYSILKELQKNKKFKTPVIINIEKNQENIKEHFIKDGFSDVIIKDNIDNTLPKIVNKYI